MAKKDEHGLTKIQRTFCDALLSDPRGDHAEAYKRAASKPNMRNGVASAAATRMLKHPEVAAYMEMRRQERAERLQPEINYSMDQCVRDLIAIQRDAMRRVPKTRRVKRVEVDEDGNRHVQYVNEPVLDERGQPVLEMIDRKTAETTTVWLGKHFGGWPNKVIHQGDEDKPIEHRHVGEGLDFDAFRAKREEAGVKRKH